MVELITFLDCAVLGAKTPSMVSFSARPGASDCNATQHNAIGVSLGGDGTVRGMGWDGRDARRLRRILCRASRRLFAGGGERFYKPFYGNEEDFLG